MKKSLLALGFTLALILSANCVFSQGSWYIGGVAGYGSNTYDPDAGDETTTTTWAFGPEVGTFPKENLQVGFILGLNGSTEKQGDSERTSSYFSPTVYLRRFKPVTDALSVFGGVYLGYSSGKIDDEGDETTGSGVGVNLGVGVAYALSPRFTAVGQYGVLGFSSITYKINGDEYAKESDFNFGVNTVGASSFVQGNGSGSVFNIGIYYTFKTAE
jgi:hypothetical protein